MNILRQALTGAASCFPADGADALVHGRSQSRKKMSVLHCQ
jgi:hypothetical protein